MKINAKREPLIHIAKRDSFDFKKNIGIRALSIIVAFLLSSIVMKILYNCSMGDFITSMWNGIFGTERRTWKFYHEIAILLGISLALAPAFKMKFWNIGADGQILIGGLATIACMYYLGGKIPEGLLIFISACAAILFGGLWGFIPAFFKAKWKTNETLFTLMMNYIAIQFVSFFINSWNTGATGKLNMLQFGRLPFLNDNKYLLNILVVLVLVIIMTIYLKFSKHGYELALVGENENTARYAGINVKKVIIRTMIFSGLICGIMGFLLTAGFNYTISTSMTDSRGFTAIIVCWLGGFNPLYMILTSVLFVFLSNGTAQLLVDQSITSSGIQNVIIAIFYFCIIAFEFFIRYKIMFVKHNKITEKEGK